MCLLIVSEKKFPSQEVLTLGNSQNPDGAGIAWVENNKVKWKKGITLEELLTYKDKKGPFLIHFRLATVGGKRGDLCHPFAIDENATCLEEGEADKVLAHNGHWNNYSRELLLTADSHIELPNGPWSDTRVMAYLAHIRGVNYLRTINEKIAVLSNDGKIEVFNKHQFSDHNGILLSYDPFGRIRKGGKTQSTNFVGSRNSYNDWEEKPSNITSSYKTGKILNSGISNYKGRKQYESIQLPLPIDA